MKKIGLISDTHGWIDDSVDEFFEDVDEIWHAGDIGDEKVIQHLNNLKPIRAVFGNIDGPPLRISLPEYYFEEIEGLNILMIHIAGSLGRYKPFVKELLKHYRPGLLICGHSHILKIAPDAANQLLYINPGAAGHHGFHYMRTLVRFEIENSKVAKLEVFELGKRGR